MDEIHGVVGTDNSWKMMVLSISMAKLSILPLGPMSTPNLPLQVAKNHGHQIKLGVEY
jgi:hypothetical protein